MFCAIRRDHWREEEEEEEEEDDDIRTRDKEEENAESVSNHSSTIQWSRGGVRWIRKRYYTYSCFRNCHFEYLSFISLARYFLFFFSSFFFHLLYRNCVLKIATTVFVPFSLFLGWKFYRRGDDCSLIIDHFIALTLLVAKRKLVESSKVNIESSFNGNVNCPET